MYSVDLSDHVASLALAAQLASTPEVQAPTVAPSVLLPQGGLQAPKVQAPTTVPIVLLPQGGTQHQPCIIGDAPPPQGGYKLGV